MLYLSQNLTDEFTWFRVTQFQKQQLNVKDFFKKRYEINEMEKSKILIIKLNGSENIHNLRT